MQRSQNENENVHFVHELAEVDGPFESPININFRELTKLELPPLTWNRNDIIPKKMKITNTGHTVIISGKWKCERPYLTGGPLTGRYVFSQIHFHWGQDDCRGSEHQVNGEGYPLEMHVAHFKTEYITQESALRERDGMVIVVYLFKLQEEPNNSLKKIIHNLSFVKQSSTSHAMDPRPIISICNPFTEDYFMYWGSVVTSTCAHILLWIVCREPFGISREQLKEFRKILDPYQQPICRNNREPQPLHKRNVFHVNASKNLSDAMLPLKKLKGCHCKKSDENICVNPEDCNCKPIKRNQEDIEGNNIEKNMEHRMKTVYTPFEEAQTRPLDWKESLANDFYMRQSLFVHSALVQSVPTFPKKSGGHESKKHSSQDSSTTPGKSESDSKVNLASHSCCFYPVNETRRFKRRSEKIKSREKKKRSNSMNPLAQIMESLDALKNHTFKKLKEIDLLNQEIVSLKFSSQGDEEKKWFQKIEKIVSRQKRLTVKTSRGYFTELKKLAKEYTFDRFFDKNFSSGDRKMVWLNEVTAQALYYSEKEAKGISSTEKTAKTFSLDQAIKFTAKAKSLIQSFFEDIKDTEDLRSNVQKELELKKLKSLCNKQVGDSTSVPSINKNYITQKMFTLGNLGDRFFTEVTTEDVEMEENGWGDKSRTKVVVRAEDIQREQSPHVCDSDETICMSSMERKNISEPVKPYSNAEEVIPLHRANVAIKFSSENRAKPTGEENKVRSLFQRTKKCRVPYFSINSDTESTSSSEKMSNKKFVVKKLQKTFPGRPTNEFTPRKPPRGFDREEMFNYFQYSSSSLSTESVDTQRMVIAKMQNKQTKRVILRKRPSLAMLSEKGFYEKLRQKKGKSTKNINFEGYYIKKKNSKSKRKKFRKEEKIKKETSSFNLLCLPGQTKDMGSQSKWKKFRKTKFKLQIEKPSDSTSDSAIGYSHASPQRKKLKLESRKIKKRILNQEDIMEESQELTDSDAPELDWPKNQLMNSSRHDTIAVQTNEENNKVTESSEMSTKHTTTDSVEKPENQLKRTSRNTLDKFKTSNKESSSTDSKISFSEKIESKKIEIRTLAIQKFKPNAESFAPVKMEPVKRELPKFFGQNSATKIKSLTNLTTGTRYLSPTNTHRGFIENLEHRWKSAREPYERRPLIADESSGIITLKYASRGISNETESTSVTETDESHGILSLKYVSEGICNELQKNSDTDTSEIHETQIRNGNEYSVGFFTTISRTEPRVIDEVEKFITNSLHEVRPKDSAIKPCRNEQYHSLEVIQEAKTIDPIIKPCDIEDRFPLDKELKPPPQESSPVHPEILLNVDSDKSIAKDVPNMKGDAELTVGDNRELQTSVSYTPIKNKPRSRPHSAESLGSLTKALRRKTKKRPHCCKRSSRHYIRKNPSVLRKLNKVQSKPIKFLDLTEEEQLKVISENVARYLKEKLVKPLENFQNPLEDYLAESIKKEKSLEEKIRATSVKDITSRNKIEIKPVQSTSNADEKDKEEKTPQTELTEETTELTKTKKSKPSGEKKRSKESESPESKKPPFSPRPVHDFIKHNKLMAGKYKRNLSPAERKLDNNPKKKDDPKTKNLRKKKEKLPSPKRAEHTKARPTDKPPRDVRKPLEKITEEQISKDARAKTSLIPKKPDSATKKTEKPPVKPKQEVKNEENPTSLTLQKVPQSQKRFTPAYALTSYLPTPVDIVQTQRKISGSLVNVSKTNIGTYLPDILYEPSARKSKEGKNDSLFMKDLEYLIKLQMCLNNEISANIENSMNYVKTMLSQDFSGTALIETPPVNDTLDIYDHSKKVVLIEMNESFECSSSSSEYAEEPGKCCFQRNMPDSLSQPVLMAKEIPKIKPPQDFGDYGIMNPALMGDFDVQEDYNSDSSYNCEISITLNAGAVEKEKEIQVFETNSLKEIYNYTYDLGGRSSVDLPRTQVEGNTSSQSLIMKPLRKKRKENEISVEMKQKLLEILESEIKREMAVSCGISTENLSDALTVTWEDSDGMNRSHSTESSCDNVEIFAQISETMRQYLTDFKERSLSERVDEPVDNESKDEDAP